MLENKGVNLLNAHCTVCGIIPTRNFDHVVDLIARLPHVDLPRGHGEEGRASELGNDGEAEEKDHRKVSKTTLGAREARMRMYMVSEGKPFCEIAAGELLLVFPGNTEAMPSVWMF